MVNDNTKKLLTEILNDKSDNIDNKDDNQELEEWKNKYLYLKADLENIKRRYNKQISDLRKYEGENIFKKIIEFIDFLELQINNTEKNQRLSEMKNKMLSLLDMFDVHPIYKERPVYFNNEYDEAILSQECNDKTLDNSIERVYKQGWMFKDKILRYEQVVVNKYNEDSD